MTPTVMASVILLRSVSGVGSSCSPARPFRRCRRALTGTMPSPVLRPATTRSARSSGISISRPPRSGPHAAPKGGSLDIEIPLLRADRVVAGRKTGEGIVPVNARLHRRNGRAGEHDEPTPDTDLSRITEAITVGVIVHCPADHPTRGRGRRRGAAAGFIVPLVLAAGLVMPGVRPMRRILPNLEGPGRPVPRGAACLVVAFLVVVVLIAVSLVRIPKGVAVRRCRAGRPGAILGDARAYRRGDQG